MSDARLGLIIADGLLVVLFLLRLVALKRDIDQYRPPSPLPPAKATMTWESLTIIRVS